jgi:hypothetical protein
MYERGKECAHAFGKTDYPFQDVSHMMIGKGGMLTMLCSDVWTAWNMSWSSNKAIHGSHIDDISPSFTRAQVSMT